MAMGERTRMCILLLSLCVLWNICTVSGQVDPPVIAGYRAVNKNEFLVDDEGRLNLFSDMNVTIRLFGDGFKVGQTVSFTTKTAERFDNCNDLRSTDLFTLLSESVNQSSALVRLHVTLVPDDGYQYYICLKDNDDWIFQGSESWMAFNFMPKPVKSTLLPLPAQVILIVLLLVFSGLFSGLNLGLMALDQTELKILISCGSAREKRYAKRIAPLRKRGNFLLCTILLGNVLVNNTLTILLDDLTGSGFAAVFGATAGIVIFGEIIPQAICSRYGLAVGANTIWFTKFFMLVTFPLSFPISKALDCALGEEIGAVYNRDRLRELLRLTQEKSGLINEEVNIITGALELSKKKVDGIMTQMEDVYMININSVLDFDTMNDIMKTGFTRVPVFDEEKTNIVAILNIKDLAFIDPDDKTPLRTVCDFYKHPIQHVFDDTKLSEVLQIFKEGRAHMAFVRTVHSEGPGDPYYETIGVVTLEDVIEEIIQSEIIDETDTITDNRKRHRTPGQTRDFSIFNKPDELHEINFPKIAPQLALATFQYLHTTVDAFKGDVISEIVLQRLIKQNVVYELRARDRERNPQTAFLYQSGRKCDYFVLILQGRVEVIVGKEQMLFEGGPFTYFGSQALLGPPGSQSINQSQTSLNSASTEQIIHSRAMNYMPDFTVKAISEYLQYLKIRRSHYDAARRATAMERKAKKEGADYFTKEWMRVANSADSASIRTEPESTNDATDRSEATEKMTPTSPSSVILDEGLTIRCPSYQDVEGLRQRSGTEGSTGGESEGFVPTPNVTPSRSRTITQGSIASEDGSIQRAPLINCDVGNNVDESPR